MTDKTAPRAVQRKPIWPKVPADFVRAVLKGHSSLGLAFAAILYLICLTGTVAVFAREFERWEHAGVPAVETVSPEAVQQALTAAVAAAGGPVEHAFIQLPTGELPQMHVNIELETGGHKSWIADGQGRLVDKGESAWTEFLTRLHINLHLPRTWGIFIVGLAGVALLSSLISGMLAHPRIFRDAFHLRLGGSRRLQEADLHNRLGVWALPFHILVSLTGAVLGLTTIIVGVLGLALFQGDVGKVYGLFLPPEPKEDARPAPVIDLLPMFAQVATLAPDGRTDLILLEHPTEMGGAAWFNVTRSEQALSNVDAYAFDRNAKIYHDKRAADNNLGESILSSIGKLHFGWFGGVLIKIAYVLLGLGLTYLAASGVNIWLARRRDKGRPAPRWERIWTSVIWGQPATLALAAFGAVALRLELSALIAMWCVLTFGVLAASLGIDRARIATGLKLTMVVALIATGLAHVARFGLSDPASVAINLVLIAIGLGFAARMLRTRQPA